MTLTSDQQALKAHIDSMNAQSQAEGSVFQLVSDLAHWADAGVYSIEDLTRYLLKTEHYNLYKEVYNIRPFWSAYEGMSNEQIQNGIDDLHAALEDSLKSDAKRESENVSAYEQSNTYQPNLALSGLGSLLKAS